MKSTMMDFPLTVTSILRHGRAVHGQREVVTWQGDGSRKVTFADSAERMERLAKALQRLGVGSGDRVGSFMWNDQEHLEAYFAVPAMGAVLHTLNIRLFPEQLVYVVNHGEDKVIIVDDSLVPLLAAVKDKFETVQQYIVVGSGDASALGENVLRYDELLAAETPGFSWPDLDEKQAAAMCYTSGTTGNPKGVVYSHRSQWTHTVGAAMAGLYLDDSDLALMVVPMFHANAWGLPYICWSVGAGMLMPGPHMGPDGVANMIAAEKPTYAAAVPTVWNWLLQYGMANEIDLSSLKRMVVGGAAVPRSMIEAFDEKYGVRIIQGWGMTEMSPLGSLAIPPAGTRPEDEMDFRVKAGRIAPGVEMRIIGDDGEPQPWDGKSVGDVEVRGPWITASYYRDDDPEKFHDGWLRTGDVGTIDGHGFLTITDRSKDVIKTGGEWISSVDLENAIMGHPDVVEAAVIGVPDVKWDERPLACVVIREGATVTPDDLRTFLADKVAKWWLPERWTFIAEVPKTSVGKFDKKVLRAQNERGELEVTTVG